MCGAAATGSAEEPHVSGHLIPRTSSHCCQQYPHYLFPQYIGCIAAWSLYGHYMVTVGHCGPLWVTVGHCGPLWVTTWPLWVTTWPLWVTTWSLYVTTWSLLVTTWSLLVTTWSLLVTTWSLLVTVCLLCLDLCCVELVSLALEKCGRETEGGERVEEGTSAANTITRYRYKYV